jgi:hypothetical protein
MRSGLVIVCREQLDLLVWRPWADDHHMIETLAPNDIDPKK